MIGSQDPYAFNICRDCLVYVAKKKDAVLSPEEIRSILAQKGIELVGHPSPEQFERAEADGLTIFCAGKEAGTNGRVPEPPVRELQDPKAV